MIIEYKDTNSWGGTIFWSLVQGISFAFAASLAYDINDGLAIGTAISLSWFVGIKFFLHFIYLWDSIGICTFGSNP